MINVFIPSKHKKFAKRIRLRQKMIIVLRSNDFSIRFIPMT